MHMRKLAALCVAAGLGAAGCVSAPMMVGEPGHLREEKEIPPSKAAAGEPAFCIATAAGPVGVGMIFSFPDYAGFRDIRLLTEEHPDPSSCDVLLKLMTNGISNFSSDEIEAYSAYTRELLWQGSAGGRIGMTGGQLLGPHLHRDFQPGTPTSNRLEQTKARGRRISSDELKDFAGGVLLSETALPFNWKQLMQMERMGLGSVPREPSPPSAAVMAAVAPAPAAAAEIRSDVDEPPPATAIQPHRYAVIIGVEKYREQLPRADYAEADARVFADYAKRVLGVPEENVALMVGERATRGDFEKYLERWLPNRVEEGGEVYVYYSGHGAPDTANGDAYLVPYDGDPTYIEQTGYPVKRLYNQLSRLPASRVVVLLDSCFSGGGGRSVIAKGSRPLVTVTPQGIPSKITVISASGANQVSNSYEARQHGLFTYFLLKGLKEKGDNLRAVFDYLKPEVAKAARREHNADQQPQWMEGR